MESYVNEGIDYGNDVIPPKIFFPCLSCATSLRSKRFQSSYSAKVGAGAKKNGRGSGKGEEETLARKPLHSFFCSRPNFLDELVRKRKLRRLVRDIYTIVKKLIGIENCFLFAKFLVCHLHLSMLLELVLASFKSVHQTYFSLVETA